PPHFPYTALFRSRWRRVSADGAAGDLVDPVGVGHGAGVDRRLDRAGRAATGAAGGTDQQPVAAFLGDLRAARVAVAGARVTAGVVGAQLGVGVDLAARASGRVDHRHVQLLQRVRAAVTTRLRGGLAPAEDARLGADVRRRAQLDRRRLDRRLQLDQGDVVGAVVVRVNGDLGRLRLFTAGGAVEAADPQLHLRRAGAVHPVRGGQHPGGGDQRTNAEVLALLLQRNDERVLLGRVVAADDVRLDFVRVVGGVGQGTGCRRTTDSRR